MPHDGIAFLFKSQFNARIELTIAGIVIIAGFLFKYKYCRMDYHIAVYCAGIGFGRN